MAQLIKLENYVSRYELDIYRYPGQFIRMKKERWERMNADHGHTVGEPWPNDSEIPEWIRREFSEDVFFFQLRWASSTLKEKSDLNPRYKFDSWLKFFLLRFPDTYLVLYHPVFQIRQAPVELDLIIAGPMGIWLVTILESSDGAVFQGESGRFWRKIEDGGTTKVLSPMLSNLRMVRLVSNLLKQYEPSPLPLHRVILSPAAFIEYPDAPADVVMIDRRNAKQWYEKMINQPSPLKFVQLKTAGLLLRHCQTLSYER